jgi:uncharacterized protein YjiS (DUF1127 family)
VASDDRASDRRSRETTDVTFTSFSMARLGRAIADEIRVRDRARALYALDDRTLADLGISRGDIEKLVRAARRYR